MCYVKNIRYFVLDGVIMQHDYVNMSNICIRYNPTNRFQTEKIYYMSICEIIILTCVLSVHAYISNSFIDMNHLHVDITISHVDI